MGTPGLSTSTSSVAGAAAARAGAAVRAQATARAAHARSAVIVLFIVVSLHEARTHQSTVPKVGARHLCTAADGCPIRHMAHHRLSSRRSFARRDLGGG